jgi:hypothetical protein
MKAPKLIARCGWTADDVDDWAAARLLGVTDEKRSRP